MQFNIKYQDFDYDITKFSLFDWLMKDWYKFIYSFRDYNNNYTFNYNTFLRIKEDINNKDKYINETISEDSDKIIVIETFWIKKQINWKLVLIEKMDQNIFSDEEYQNLKENDNITENLKEKYFNYDLYIFTKEYENLFKIENYLVNKVWLKEFKPIEDNEDKIFITKVFEKKGELIEKRHKHYIANLEKIDLNLYPNYDIVKLTKLYNNSDENLLLLNWQPWTGKTSFIKYFFTQLKDDSEVLYTTDINTLKNEEFWDMVEENEYQYLIIDDIDNVIQQRDFKSNEINIVNKLLTALDGIIRNNIKIIITTNLKANDIDEALLRSGRCFALLEIFPLDYKEALKIWENWWMDKMIFIEKFKKDEKVLQSDLVQLRKNIQKNILKESFIKK